MRPTRRQRQRRAGRALFGVAALAVALVSCTGKDPYRPGTALGTFHVDGALLATSCGAAPDPWTFDVKLARDARTLYWIQGGLPVAGTLDASAHASLTATDTQTIQAADAGIIGCAVTRDDTLDTALVVAAADVNDVAAFSGKLTYTFRATAGSDCSGELAIAGGDFAQLPCSITYTLKGTRTAR